VPPSKPINKSLSTSETFRVLTEMPRVIPQWLLSQTPSWLNRKNIAVACFGGAIGLGFVKVVVPKVKTTLHNIAILQSQVVAITALLRYSNIKFWAFPPALDKAGHLEYNKAASFLFGIKKQ